MAKGSKKLPRFVAASQKGLKKSDLRVAGDAASRAKRVEGKQLRAKSPREAHDTIGKLPPTRDPVALILASNDDRVPALIPVRHSRMLESPFAFYRGTAAIQAHDLAHAPSSGVTVQCCGDAHLMNFGGFASPERRFVFDLNDFDETYPAPFEWDVKRLAASFALAARWRGFSEGDAKDIAEGTARGYRDRIVASADEATLDVWYAAVTWEGIRDQVAGTGMTKLVKDVDKLVAKARDRSGESRISQTDRFQQRRTAPLGPAAAALPSTRYRSNRSSQAVS